MTPAPPVAVPRPASTVALLRPGPGGPEVLLTHRPATMAFGPGLHVFPGGAVDPADADPRLLARATRSPEACASALAGELAPEVAAAHHVAAVRELYEEAGVLLARPAGERAFDATAGPAARELARARAGGLAFGALLAALDLRPDTDALVPLSRWVTPPVMSRRFDARFFVAAIPPGAEASSTGDEVAAYEWLSPEAAIAARAAGRLELWPPTSATLRQLAAARDLDDVRVHLSPRRPARPPEVERLGPAVVRVRVHGAGGIPGASVNTHLVGRDRLVVVDPGDPNDEAADAILAAAAAGGGRIVAVVLTQPAPDHAGGAESLALRLRIAVHGAPGGAGELPHGVEPLRDGERLADGDVALRALATPGVHADHLALDASDEGFVLVGDLDGDAPDRGIPVPPDADALEGSRARVRALGARRWLPGHGDPRPA